MNEKAPSSTQIPAAVTEIAKRASLKTINLVRGSSEFVEALAPGEGIENLQVSLRAGGSRHDAPGSIVCGFGIDVAAQTKGAKPKTVARFSCDYAGVYEVRDEGFYNSLSDRDIAVFAGYNTGFHTWPYAREFVQSMAARMGLPAVVLPLFRAAEVVPPEDWEERPQE